MLVVPLHYLQATPHLWQTPSCNTRVHMPPFHHVHCACSTVFDIHRPYILCIIFQPRPSVMSTMQCPMTIHGPCVVNLPRSTCLRQGILCPSNVLMLSCVTSAEDLLAMLLSVSYSAGYKGCLSKRTGCITSLGRMRSVHSYVVSYVGIKIMRWQPCLRDEQ